MSVLSFPRIYFKGFMEWDPCTFNNNDWSQFLTYDARKAALNWPFLATQGITPENFTETFRPWAITLQNDQTDSPAGQRVPCEWNMFGSHGVSFVQHGEYTSTITGGDLAFGQPSNGDPLIGSPVVIAGDGGNGPGRLVDTNPSSPWSSQIYFGQMGFGAGANAVTAPRAFRMHSRWLNPNRIFSTQQILTAPAAAIGVCFQTCIPFDEVQWPAGASSPLLATLQTAASQPGALGIMIRFTGYVNLYFVNGILNSQPAQPQNYADLAKALAKAFDVYNNSGGQDTSAFFSNPCYSHVVGVVGVWNEGELASVPGGRCLNADQPVLPLDASQKRRVQIQGHELKANVAESPIQLGPVAVNVDFNSGLISLDCSATMPELGTPGAWPSDLSKANFGTLSFGSMQGSAFTQIAAIPYDQYSRDAYEARAGIIDIPIPGDTARELLESASFAIQVNGVTALLEQALTAETDSRGIYLDQGESTEFQIAVFQNGVPAAGASVMVVRYADENLDANGNLALISSSQPGRVTFTNGTPRTVTAGSGSSAIFADVIVVETDANGIATVGIAAQSPGFPVLAFYPFTDPELPQPGAEFNFTDDAYYTTVRVLPFDDGVPYEFIALWKTLRDRDLAWAFVYNNILYVYDMLFSVMLKYVNLGSREAVEQNIDSILSAISAEAAAESTFAMPITRDLSAGKRKTLQLWASLVKTGSLDEDLMTPGA